MKIVILASYAPSILNFRIDLIKSMLQLGNQVVAVAPFTDCESADSLRQVGVECVSIEIDRVGLNPFLDFKLYRGLVLLFREIKPDMVLSYTIKPVIYGSIAANKVGVKFISSIITGLGSVFISNKISLIMTKIVVKFLYKKSLSKNKIVFFQNKDDFNMFYNLGIVEKDKCEIINGSGVNLSEFKFLPRPDSICFSLIARVIKEKGIMEFLKAAEYIKLKYPFVKFKLIGPLSKKKSRIKIDEINNWVHRGVVEYKGGLKSECILDELASTSVYVLPSYREGTPRSVLEAMAVGRPIITSDCPGCRETVEVGFNGFLVPLKDYQAIIVAMEYFITNTDEIIRMGTNSRIFVEDKYDVHKVNAKIMENLELIDV